jgi:hypothetical protein
MTPHYVIVGQSMMNNFEIKKILGGEAKDNSWDSTYN